MLPLWPSSLLSHIKLSFSFLVAVFPIDWSIYDCFEMERRHPAQWLVQPLLEMVLGGNSKPRDLRDLMAVG